MNSSNTRNPVLLIHGIWDTSALFNTMTAYLTKLGWPVYSLDLIPNNCDIGLDELARQVADYAANIFESAQRFDLIGFSMGGIVSRYYVQRLGGINRVQRFITISSPHQGTWLAHSSRRPGYLQMCPRSEFLLDLDRDVKMLDQLNFTSIWTPFDLMIVPANSSKMPVGKEVVLPIPLHSQMVTDPRSLKVVAKALMSPIKVNTVVETIDR
ncbi:esterase/lipase family protein [Microcoleus sp. FACHB-672]|uniref:esterase/lipase family protein n=1 Tax=Microcoleus sp. FACHB-672 TaxID=2692825 RepID=UPI001689C88D|nr:alpha/beta fold hydrolase [Microcoleus sp. FACHB-672]MBD2039463.1 alpha/beta fold hydrolase [Microcoleus sp. FACHB-672]